MAIGVALDRSGSMTGLPLHMAKASASALVSSLCEADTLELIAFDAIPKRIVASVSAKRRTEMLTAIEGITAGGGTELFSTLDALHAALIAVEIPRRHVVVITDGRFPTNGVEELVDAMVIDDVTVSTIAISQDADAELLAQMASAGGGRFQLVQDLAQLPAVLVQEVRTARADARR